MIQSLRTEEAGRNGVLRAIRGVAGSLLLALASATIAGVGRIGPPCLRQTPLITRIDSLRIVPHLRKITRSNKALAKAYDKVLPRLPDDVLLATSMPVTTSRCAIEKGVHAETQAELRVLRQGSSAFGG